MTEQEESNQAGDTGEQPRGIYRGWGIVAASGIFHGLFGGLYHTGISVYFLPLLRDFQISRTTLSLAFSLRTLEGGIEGPLAGYMVDRFGPRSVIVFGVVAGGVGFLLLSATRSYPIFLLVFLGLLTVGFSAPFHGMAYSINQWFRVRLGMAMSLAAAGSAIGGFLLTPAVAWVVLNDDLGWRWAAIISGLILLVIGPPLAFAFRRPTEEEAAVDEAPRSVVGTTAGETPRVFEDFTVREALHTRIYWVLALAIGLRLTAQSALMVHLVPILVSRQVDESVGASLVALMALARLPSMIGAGWLADRWSRPKVSALSMVAGVLASGAVLWGPDGIRTGVGFVLLFAVAQASNSITWALIGQFFGRTSFGTLRGGVTMVQSLMSTGGPIAAGWVFDRWGNYTNALLGIGVLYLVSAVVFWGLKEPMKPMSRVPSAAARDTPDVG
jgi:MFS family permease